ncbi:MAG: hypothetical protein ACP5SQ_07715 [Candidatus Saccharicenans sp.]
MNKINKRNAVPFIFLVISFLALVASLFFYLGYHYFYGYQKEMTNIKSLEHDFPRLEKKLKAAIRCYPWPAFQTELGRLYLLRAMAEIEFGRVEKSGEFLDKARAALGKSISENPLDYAPFWELSKIYFLYDYPLPIYASTGRNICREAVRRYPANEFLNLNVLFVFFEQWDLLEPAEKDWVKSRLLELKAANSGFLDQLKKKWQQNHGETTTITGRLKEIGL